MPRRPLSRCPSSGASEPDASQSGASEPREHARDHLAGVEAPASGSRRPTQSRAQDLGVNERAGHPRLMGGQPGDLEPGSRDTQRRRAEAHRVGTLEAGACRSSAVSLRGRATALPADRPRPGRARQAGCRYPCAGIPGAPPGVREREHPRSWTGRRAGSRSAGRDRRPGRRAWRRRTSAARVPLRRGARPRGREPAAPLRRHAHEARARPDGHRPSPTGSAAPRRRDGFLKRRAPGPLSWLRAWRAAHPHHAFSDHTTRQPTCARSPSGFRRFR